MSAVGSGVQRGTGMGDRAASMPDLARAGSAPAGLGAGVLKGSREVTKVDPPGSPEDARPVRKLLKKIPHAAEYGDTISLCISRRCLHVVFGIQPPARTGPPPVATINDLKRYEDYPESRHLAFVELVDGVRPYTKTRGLFNFEINKLVLRKLERVDTKLAKEAFFKEVIISLAITYGKLAVDVILQYMSNRAVASLIMAIASGCIKGSAKCVAHARVHGGKGKALPARVLFDLVGETVTWLIGFLSFGLISNPALMTGSKGLFKHIFEEIWEGRKDYLRQRTMCLEFSMAAFKGLLRDLSQWLFRYALYEYYCQSSQEGMCNREGIVDEQVGHIGNIAGSIAAAVLLNIFVEYCFILPEPKDKID